MIKLPIILIDNGHGINTPGKRSPDAVLGKYNSPFFFREYQYTREIAKALSSALKEKGITNYLLVKEEEDIALSERTERVKAYCRQYGTQNVILVSIHVDAAADSSEWKNARGWSVWTSPGKTESDTLATSLHNAAIEFLENGEYGKTEFSKKQKPIRSDLSDGDVDFEANFWILRKTPCTAVLTENLFQDNKEDVAFLLSESGRNAIVNLHCKGIIDYINNSKKW